MFIATLQIDYYGSSYSAPYSSNHVLGGYYESKAIAVKVAEEIDAGTVQDGCLQLMHNEYSRSGRALEVIDKFREDHDSEDIEKCAEMNADSIIVRDPMRYHDTLVCVPVE